MTFRIERAVRGEIAVFVVSGRLESEAIRELTRLLEPQPDRHQTILDLKDVGVIDRDVVLFLMSREAAGVKLENCTPYIREWMERERD